MKRHLVVTAMLLAPFAAPAHAHSGAHVTRISEGCIQKVKIPWQAAFIWLILAATGATVPAALELWPSRRPRLQSVLPVRMTLGSAIGRHQARSVPSERPLVPHILW